jgi:hypothetical protein
VPGGQPFAGGNSVVTPFGAIRSPNLTPDRATGIGAWTDENFIRAMREGIRHNGEHLYPAFPYPWYSRVTRKDLLAIRAYLATLPPVRNAMRRTELPFPYERDKMLCRCLSERRLISACGRKIQLVESRRLSGGWPWPLRRLSYTEE